MLKAIYQAQFTEPIDVERYIDRITPKREIEMEDPEEKANDIISNISAKLERLGK